MILDPRVMPVIIPNPSMWKRRRRVEYLWRIGCASFGALLAEVLRIYLG